MGFLKYNKLNYWQFNYLSMLSFYNCRSPILFAQLCSEIFSQMYVSLFNYPSFSISECLIWILAWIARTSETSQKIAILDIPFCRKSALKIRGISYDPKALILTNFWLGPTSFIFHISSKSKKIWNSYLNHFQQLLFHNFPPPMNSNLLVLVLMPRI